MKLKSLITTSLLTLFSFQAYATEFNAIGGWSVNYDWMDKAINQTPATGGSCQNLQLDVYRNGFKVARETNYYLSVNASMAEWFQDLSLWASVGVGPVKDGFGIFFTQADTTQQINDVKSKKLPMKASEIAKWKVTDAAYWESFGGVSMYLGAGISPFSLSAFAVATGGWTNYLEKTGPNKVYVQRAKKTIRSISFGASVSFPSASHQRLVHAATGFSYEFTLNSPESIEAFERFMVGDLTKAQELAVFEDSGVMQIADSSARKVGFVNSIGVATPFIPVLSFRSSRERSFDVYEESSNWDENTERNHGIYVKQRRTRLFDKHLRESRSFTGGMTTKDVPDYLTGGREETESLYGTFSYHYESDWGQKLRLKRYIKRAQDFTGIKDVTCVNVPSVQNTLGYNQVKLDLKISDDYMRALIGLKGSTNRLFAQLEATALRYEAANAQSRPCDNDNRGMGNDRCTTNDPASVKSGIRTMKSLSAQMKAQYLKKDRTAFSKSVAKFAEQVWKSPSIFNAVYEKGKSCGQVLEFEVSGRRITRAYKTTGSEFGSNCL